MSDNMESAEVAKKIEALCLIREAILIHGGFMYDKGSGSNDRLTRDEMRLLLEDMDEYLPVIMEKLKEIQSIVEEI